MSEEIDLNINNLCIPEDAFEEFQASSMYEEDEFITLADIVSPQPQAPDLSMDLNDIPYENEVVLESQLEDQVPEVNSTIEIGIEDNKTSETFLPPSDEPILEGHSEIVPESKPKRGRRKKTQQSASILTVNQYGNEQINNTQVVSSPDNIPTKSTPQSNGRRGRKRNGQANARRKVSSRKSSVGIQEICDNTELKSDSHLSSPPLSSGVSENENASVDRKSRRRPGRPKKKPIINEDIPKEEETEMIKTELHATKSKSNDLHITDNTVNTITPKRGRRKRQEVKNNKSYIGDESTHNEPEPETTFDENNLDQSQAEEIGEPSLSDHVPVKTTKKRKKSKKTHDATIIKNQQDISTTMDEDEDDMNDDICLSKLRETLDPNDTSDKDKNKTEEGETIEMILEEIKATEPHPAEINAEFPTMPDVKSDKEELTDNKEELEDNKEELTDNKEELTDNKEELTDIKEELTDNKEELTDNKDVNTDVEHKEEIQTANKSNEDVTDSLLVEDTSKRPTRVKARRTFNYDDGSDEDPYANMESSDDEPKRGKKGKKYYSDDEYVPGGGKRANISSSDVSDSDIDAEVDELMMTQRRKKQRLDSSLGQSPKKRGRKPKSAIEGNGNSSLEIKTIEPNKAQDDDVEICLQSSQIKADDDSKKKLGWGASSEFENFLAKRIQGTEIKIKKSSSVQPLEIPVIDPQDAKKTVETGMQTTQITTNSVDVQTSAPYDIPMKDNVPLTSEQAENACEFLKGIVKTTAELGQLMTQKSEAFINKKINTSHITDTLKMDYCVRKSFLLFKLAKHNLMQMEEDLSNQYEEFLNKNDLMKHREKPKVVIPIKKEDDGDSDCEIIDAPTPSTTIQKPKQGNVKPKFNPKTVFLNKELSIKIAKKPTAAEIKQQEQKLKQIKGRHTVWISDTVMVKKVKPTQSFLAQDSRNKKPPDYVTIEMVNNFFKEYDRQQVLLTCAPFVTPHWSTFNKKYVCSYFFTKSDDLSSTITDIPSGSELNTSPESQVTVTKDRCCQNSNVEQKKYSPKSLFTLCTQALQSCLNVSIPTVQNDTEIEETDSANNSKCPETLYSLCVKNIQAIQSSSEEQKYVENDLIVRVVPLQTLCFQKVIEVMDNHQTEPEVEVHTATQHNLDAKSDLCELNTDEYDAPGQDVLSLTDEYDAPGQDDLSLTDEYDAPGQDVLSLTDECDAAGQDVLSLTDEYDVPSQDVLSLFSLCVRFIQNQMYSNNIFKKHVSYKYPSLNTVNTPITLKKITFKVIAKLINSNNLIEDKNCVSKVKTLSDLCFEIITKSFNDNQEHTPKESLTINCINRLTEEAYFNLEESSNFTDNLEYYADEDDDDTNFYEDQAEEHDFNDFDETDNTEYNNWISQVEMKELISIPNKITETLKPTVEKNALPVTEEVALTRIKIEPDEEQEQIVDPALVKTEPLHNLDEMTIIPESIMTNTATPENERKGSASYDVESFEAFVKTNKMMHALNEQDTDEVFTQSTSRVRRQYEPDSDTENDMGMSLLVPQTYEPLFIENAKDSLMESSGDENSSAKKPASKKKIDRRKLKGKKFEATKPDKPLEKLSTKEIPKEKPLEKSSTKEIPKDKQLVSNEIAVLTRKMRGKIRQEEKKIASSDSETETNKESTKENSKAKQKTGKPIEDEIQCNNVDSTEQLTEQKKCNSPDPSTLSFTGFSAIDQNEVSNYQKYVKYVYDKILPPESEEGQAKQDTNSSYFNSEEPVELLECEPTMPFMDDGEDTKKVAKELKKTSKKEVAIKKSPAIAQQDECAPPYNMRDGWKCYQLDTNDAKLYSDAQIVLDKLPEAFVDTYFKYQNISRSNKEDEEVDRLINLQSLNRAAPKEVPKRGRGRPKKLQPKDETSTNTPEGSNTDSRAASPANSVNYDELTPSEDEDAKADDQPLAAKKDNCSENTLAKSSLMDDNESDEDAPLKIKKEIPDEDTTETPVIKRRPGPKSKTRPAEPVVDSEALLTADKMMNRELNLLHAPIVIGEEPKEVSSKGPSTRNKQKHSSKSASGSKHVKAGDDGSSSEEEKLQWFTIKEKLLKKMINKKDTTREDDAKRAKLVSEFIERRGDLAENYLKRRKGGRSKRSLKKMLERQKQFKVLSRELFGDIPETAHTGKGRNSSYFKGRRNIRKVLDKKSLAKSTVLANMEEFERKRRINMRQCKLRELLGCEEGVNVLVINDEVCLEYDFETHRPVVTIHPFFTKVMKAHQYEGVKFMWDACFESLAHVEAGHPGGGCILAHCMGLGKTLQVLALLHTVLTHPRVGMQRVLVCCPLSTVLNWVDEIHKWIGPVTDKIKVFELSKLRKTNVRAYQLEDWYKGGGIFIIGYELFRSLTTLDPYLDNVRPVIINKIRNALLDPGPDIIICDEGHLLKNDCSVLAVAMSRVRTQRRIMLTGTPMQNNLREYYCMVNFVKPNLLGTYAEYSNRFENPIMNGQHRDSREEDIRLMKARTHILHKVLEGCLQRQEASVLYPYLPKKHEYTVFVSLSKCQWDLYKHYLQNCTTTQTNKHNNVLKDFHMLQKIWSHPQVLHNFQCRSSDDIKSKIKIEKLEDDLAREDLNAEDMKPTPTDTWWLQYLDGGETLHALHSSNKFVCVFRILEECIALGDKLLIFSTSLFTMDALEYFLKKIKSWSLGKEYYRLDGSVPAEVRQKWCREFNADTNVNTKLFLISTRAGCLGLNMTAANRVIILDTSWNPAHDIQSIFRVYRFGQKKDCYIYRLVALGTMEQKIYERSVTKQAVACRVVDEQQIDRHYNMADLTELYKYDEAGVGVAGGVAVGVEDVVLLRVARDINLHAVHEHDSLLRGSAEQGLPEHERNAAWMQFQQEHAHKQIEDEPTHILPEAVHGHDYAKLPGTKSLVIKTELQEAAAFKPKPEKKRGPKKNSIITCSIPIESMPTQNTHPPIDQNREEELVNKITHILIKHNFHVRQEPRQIADLVSNVRKIVASGRLEDLQETDELSASIANLLLQNDLPMRQLTNIVCESVNNSIGEKAASSSKEEPKPERRGRGRPKGKKGYVYEEVKPVEKEPDAEYDGRKRRRAALQAEKSFDKITGDTDITEKGDESDTEFVPNAIVRMQVENDRIENDRLHNVTVKQEPMDDTTNKRKSYQKADKVKSKRDASPKNDFIDMQTEILHEEMNSILLSDDDEPPPPKRRPGPARKTMVNKQREEKVNNAEHIQSKVIPKTEPIETPEPNVIEKDEEKIPLHPSLLSNQNFIKIVAHTYLTGNPMLDEDAATLAAQYSTQKVLKEYESTGKEIITGPLYDIAIQVLGKDIIKKLHETKGKADLKSNQPTPEKHVEKPTETVKETPEPPKAGPTLKTIKLKIRMPSSSSSTPIMSSSLTPVVVSSSLTPAVMTSSSLTVQTSSRSSPMPSSRSSPMPPLRLPVLTPAPTPKVVPVGFYRLDVPRPVAAWSRVNINSCLEPRDGFDYTYEFDSFKGAAEIPANNTHQPFDDECILPDDDDIRIVSDPVTPQPAPMVHPVHLTPAPTFQSLHLTPSTVQPLHLTSTPTGKPLNLIPVPASAVPEVARRQSLKFVLNKVKSGTEVTPREMQTNTSAQNTPSYVNNAPAPSRYPKRNETPREVQTNTSAQNTPSNVNNAPTPSRAYPKRNETPREVQTNTSAHNTPSYVNNTPAPSRAYPKRHETPREVQTNTSAQNTPSNVNIAPAPSRAYPKRNESIASAASAAPQPTKLSMDPNTISLDSDDEDILPSVNVSAPASAAPPVPVSLKASKYFTQSSTTSSAAKPPPKILNHQFDSVPSGGSITLAISRTPKTQGPISETVNIINDDEESILPVSTPPKEKEVQKLCKPGDVLRISKSGKVEVLNRKDQTVGQTKPIPAVAPNPKTVTSPVTIEIDDTPTVPIEISTRNKRSIDMETKRKETPSMSGVSRPQSSSSADPLSILRDVIHIEADDYEAPPPSNNKTDTKDTPPKTVTNSNNKSESLLVKSIAKDKATASKITSSPWYKRFREKPLPVKQTVSAQSIIDNFKSSGIKVSVASANKKGSNAKTVEPSQVTKKVVPARDLKKDKRATETVDMTTIDLSSFDAPAAPDRSKGRPKVTITGSTIVGTSKDIILCGAGKAVKRAQATPAVQVLETARASTSTESPAKKKKTDKPMTLKDFDIDDIDDIIELD